ncbi:MAG: hypothetical protein JSW71_15560 [Gemmatimonadota bacterium]|nr:MAG: hypothetical protein JSW71_15560 [Gemmatimonadota bacterium]
MRQSSGLPPLLPACLVVTTLGAVGTFTPPMHWQERYRVIRAENFRREASGDSPVLARVLTGTELPGTSAAGGDWIGVTLEGWIWSASVRPSNQDSLNLRVMADGGENLRDAPNGTILARLAEGTYLDELSRSGSWIRVRREGFMWAASLEPARSQSSDAGARPERTVGDSTVTLDRAVLAHQAPLLNVPRGSETATLQGETPVKVLARSGEWVRIQTEGWVRESDLKPPADGVLEGVTGAEVRGRPAEYEGKLLQWTLQYLATQQADELRIEIPQGRSYMLARGPLPEAGFVYVVLSQEQLPEVERLSPLTQVVVIGRVRVARSRYLGNPILELVDIAVRQQ